MGFSASSLWTTPSCTKAVTVQLGKDKTLKLKQGKEITVNNEVVEKLPLSLGDTYVRVASSIFIQGNSILSEFYLDVTTFILIIFHI